jgi:hypothetical protein
MPLVFYYSAPGNYATTQGTVNIPAAGYYYNVPLAVPAPVNPAPAQGFTYSFFYYPPNSSSSNASANRPVQGSTYSYTSFYYYPPAPSFGYGGVGSNVLRRVPMTGSGYGISLMEGPRGPTPPGGG